MTSKIDIPQGETDTYEPKDRSEKEAIDRISIEEHWAIRAEREGVQAVMSARHSLSENEEATQLLQAEVLAFLQGHIESKKIFELGSGIGRMTRILAQKAQTVTGIDFSEKMLERARQNLVGLVNIELHQGRITDLDFPTKSFDLAFESIVLLHILDPTEVRATVEKMRDLARQVFLVEHTDEGPHFPISKYSILRTPEEYIELMQPYRLIKQKEHSCAGDRFTLMLFEE